jgi:hypothetical protein
VTTALRRLISTPEETRVIDPAFPKNKGRSTTLGRKTSFWPTSKKQILSQRAFSKEMNEWDAKAHPSLTRGKMKRNHTENERSIDRCECEQRHSSYLASISFNNRGWQRRGKSRIQLDLVGRVLARVVSSNANRDNLFRTVEEHLRVDKKSSSEEIEAHTISRVHSKD